MNLIGIALILIIVGVLLWLANAYIPMQATIKKILNIAVVVITIIWLIRVSGLWQYIESVHT